MLLNTFLLLSQTTLGGSCQVNFAGNGFGFKGNNVKATGDSDGPGACCSESCCTANNGEWMQGPTYQQMLGDYWLDKKNYEGSISAYSGKLVCSGNLRPQGSWADRFTDYPSPTWDREPTFTHTDTNAEGDWMLKVIEPAKTDADKAINIANIIFEGGKPVLSLLGKKGKILKGVLGGALEVLTQTAGSKPTLSIDLKDSVDRILKLTEMGAKKNDLTDALEDVEIQVDKVAAFKTDLKSDTVLSVIRGKTSTFIHDLNEAYRTTWADNFIDPTKGGAKEAAYYLHESAFSFFTVNFEFHKLHFMTTLAMVQEQTTEADALKWRAQACGDLADYMYGNDMGGFAVQWARYEKYFNTALQVRLAAVTPNTCYGGITENKRDNSWGAYKFHQRFNAGMEWKDTWKYGTTSEKPSWKAGWSAYMYWYQTNEWAMQHPQCSLQYDGLAIPNMAAFTTFTEKQRDAYVNQIKDWFAKRWIAAVEAKEAMWRNMRTNEFICEKTKYADWQNQADKEGTLLPDQFCLKLGKGVVDLKVGSTTRKAARVDLVQMSSTNAFMDMGDDCRIIKNYWPGAGKAGDHRIFGTGPGECKAMCNSNKGCGQWSWRTGSCFLRHYTDAGEELRAALYEYSQFDAGNTMHHREGEAYSGHGVKDTCSKLGGIRYDGGQDYRQLPKGTMCSGSQRYRWASKFENYSGGTITKRNEQNDRVSMSFYARSDLIRALRTNCDVDRDRFQAACQAMCDADSKCQGFTVNSQAFKGTDRNGNKNGCFCHIYSGCRAFDLKHRVSEPVIGFQKIYTLDDPDDYSDWSWTQNRKGEYYPLPEGRHCVGNAKRSLGFTRSIADDAAYNAAQEDCQAICDSRSKCVAYGLSSPSGAIGSMAMCGVVEGDRHTACNLADKPSPGSMTYWVKAIDDVTDLVPTKIAPTSTCQANGCKQVQSKEECTAVGAAFDMTARAANGADWNHDIKPAGCFTYSGATSEFNTNLDSTFGSAWPWARKLCLCPRGNEPEVGATIEVEVFGGSVGNLVSKFKGKMNVRTDWLNILENDGVTDGNAMGIHGLASSDEYAFANDDLYICPSREAPASRRLARLEGGN